MPPRPSLLQSLEATKSVQTLANLGRFVLKALASGCGPVTANLVHETDTHRFVEIIGGRLHGAFYETVALDDSEEAV